MASPNVATAATISADVDIYPFGTDSHSVSGGATVTASKSGSNDEGDAASGSLSVSIVPPAGSPDRRTIVMDSHCHAITTGGGGATAGGQAHYAANWGIYALDGQGVIDPTRPLSGILTLTLQLDATFQGYGESATSSCGCQFTYGYVPGFSTTAHATPGNPYFVAVSHELVGSFDVVSGQLGVGWLLANDGAGANASGVSAPSDMADTAASLQWVGAAFTPTGGAPLVQHVDYDIVEIFDRTRGDTLPYGYMYGTDGGPANISGNPDQVWVGLSPSPIPEPAALALLAVGGLALLRRQKC